MMCFAQDTPTFAVYDPVAAGKRLRAARERAGLGVSTLASRSGVDRTTIWRLETGGHDGGMGTLYLLCREIGCSADDVLGLGAS